MELSLLTKSWKDKVNLEHSSNAQLSAIVVNALSSSGSSPVSAADFLPFKLPPRYLTVAEAEALFARMEGPVKTITDN